MKAPKMLLVVLALMAPLTLGLVGSAEAVVTLHTPALLGPSSENVHCVVTNVSSVAYSMTITVIDNDGTETPGIGPVTLGPRDSIQHAFAVGVGDKWIRCKFVGGGSNKNNFRAAIVTPSDALPAQ